MFSFFNTKYNDKNIDHISKFKNEENSSEIKLCTLIEAVEKQDINLVRELIKKGVDINEQNSNGDTALIIAVMLKSDKKVLDKKASKKSVTPSNILDSKLQNTKYEIVEYLLENGANVYQKNKYHYNIMEIMRGKSYYDDIIQIFNRYGYIDPRKPIQAVKEAVENKIKKTNYNGYKDGITHLYYAILFENLEQIEYLLKNNVDINLKNSDDNEDYKNFDLYWRHKDKTSLELSIKKANIEIIELLVKYNADINTLLYFAVKKDKFEISKLLLHKGANPNRINSLVLACKNQNLKMIKLLIEYKTDTNFTGDDGRTALFDAIEATKANKEIISYLIQNGADIHKEDSKGITPLSFAQTNKKSLVKVLTENEEVDLSENNNSKIATSYKDITDKIISQNKVINQLKDEVKTIKNIDTNSKNKAIRVELDTFKETILSQSNKIKELQNDLISKEEDTKKLIENLILIINKLEKKLEKQKVLKTKIPLDIHAEKKSIKKDDGVIVKRESFDDF